MLRLSVGISDWKSRLITIWSSQSFYLRFLIFDSMTLKFCCWIVIVVVVETVWPSLLVLSSRFFITTFELIGCNKAIIAILDFQLRILLFLCSILGDHSLKSSPILLVFSDKAINSSNFSLPRTLVLFYFEQFCNLVIFALQQSHSSYKSWTISYPCYSIKS